MSLLLGESRRRKQTTYDCFTQNSQPACGRTSLKNKHTKYGNFGNAKLLKIMEKNLMCGHFRNYFPQYLFLSFDQEKSKTDKK